MSGINGKVIFTNGETSVHSWTLSYAGDVLETTDFDDSTGGRSYIPGLTGWTGSYDCFWSSGNTAIPGGTGTIKLQTGVSTSSNLFTGAIIITGMDVATPVDGIVTQTYTFQGNGTLGTSV